MKYGIVLSILMLFSSFTTAENYLHLGMLSKHFSGRDYREKHPLIAVESSNWMIGYYLNSHDRSSYFVFRTDRWFEVIHNVHIGAKYGVISGYEHLPKLFEVKGSRASFAAVPTLFLDFRPVSVDINILGPVISVEGKIAF